MCAPVNQFPASKLDEAVEVEIDLGGSTCSKTVPAGSKLAILSPDGSTLLSIQTLCYVQSLHVHHLGVRYVEPQSLRSIIEKRNPANL